MSDTASSDIVIIGKFGSPHGIRGWVKVHSFTQPLDNILNYHPWLFKLKNHWEPLVYTEVEQHGNQLLVKLKDCEDRNTAESYTNKEIGLYREQLPALPEGEYYWKDLEGLNVMNKQGNCLGKVDYLFETGSNDVLVVKGDKEYLIPYLPGSTILKVDLAEKVIFVEWDPE